MSDARADHAPETFLKQYAILDERGRRSFTEAIQELQLRCFVLRGGSLRINREYAFIERYEDLVNAYLTLGGWRLGLDRDNGVARLYHPESSGRVRFNKSETTLILALRLLYHEQKRVVSEDIEPVITVGALREKLHSLLPITAARPFLGRKIMGTALRRLERFSIVAFEDSSYVVSNDTKLRVQPVLDHLVRLESVEAIDRRLRELYDAAGPGESAGDPEGREGDDEEAD